MSADGAVPVGRTVKRWRRFREMTQEGLGSAAHLHAGTISRVERGVHKPDVATLEAIASVLGTTAPALLAGVEPDAVAGLAEPQPAGKRATS